MRFRKIMRLRPAPCISAQAFEGIFHEDFWDIEKDRELVIYIKILWFRTLGRFRDFWEENFPEVSLEEAIEEVQELEELEEAEKKLLVKILLISSLGGFRAFREEDVVGVLLEEALEKVPHEDVGDREERREEAVHDEPPVGVESCDNCTVWKKDETT